MISQILYSLCFIVFLNSCQNYRKPREIILGNERVKGVISKDTIFNGSIRFYNKKTNRLISECNYKDGKLNGERKDFYDNGKLSSLSYYDDDKLTGEVTVYSKNGEKLKVEFYYYGYQVGHSTKFVLKKPQEYFFYSFGGEPIFSISYDTTLRKRITDVQLNYFFINKRESTDISPEGFIGQNIEVFIYMPQPPLYNFRYYLVLTDTLYDQVKIVKELNNNEPWSRFIVNLSEKRNDKLEYAIKLLVTDSIAGGDFTMYKKL